MKYRIESSDNKKPAYIQLYLQIRNDIVSGNYSYGAKLPSKRILSEESGVSVITVEHAYSILCDEGYVESRQRSGYFVIYREKDFISLVDNEQIIHQRNINKSDAQEMQTVLPYSVLAKKL